MSRINGLAKIKSRRQRRLCTLLFVVVIVAVAATGCGSSKAPSGPFNGSSSKLATATTTAVDNASASPGLAKPPTVHCASEAWGNTGCSIVYTIKEPAGINYGNETILPSTGVFKYAFSDKKVDSVTVTVQGPVTSTGGKSSTAKLFSLYCTRGSANQIDWDNVTVNGLKQLCRFDQFVNNP